jgi:PhnB protein
MATKVKAKPDEYNTATTYLIVNDAAKAIEFYKNAFDAQELFRFEHEGKIGHAEIRIGDTRIMLADEYPDMGYRGPQAYGGSPVSIYLYVEDADRVANSAVAAGSKILQPIEDKFYGDRVGTIQDPFGHVWHVSTHKEDLTPEEMKRRAEAIK